MNYTKGQWIADIRVGVAAVYVKPKDPQEFNCLNGRRDACLYWANGEQKRDSKGGFIEWTLSEEQIANARLIAAAPAMYEALKELIDEYWANKGSDGKFPHPSEFISCITPRGIPDYWKRADRAIRAAEGK